MRLGKLFDSKVQPVERSAISYECSPQLVIVAGFPIKARRVVRDNA